MTIEIPLTKGKVAIVDDCDADLAQHNWCASYGYARRAVPTNGKYVQVSMHRVIAERIIGRPLMSNEVVDHVDRDKANNVRGNIRVCSQRENLRNTVRHANSRYSYKGVSSVPNWNKYMAKIRVGSKSIYLGAFVSEVDAALAYDKAAREHFGDFARLNFPDIADYSNVHCVSKTRKKAS